MRGIRRAQCRSDDLGIAHATGVVRQSPHRHHIGHREGEAQGRTLRQHGQPPRPLLARPLAERPLIQRHAADIGLELAAQGTEQGALAGAIGAKHTEHLARTQGQVDTLQHRDATAAHTQVLRAQHQARPRTSR